MTVAVLWDQFYWHLKWVRREWVQWNQSLNLYLKSFLFLQLKFSFSLIWGHIVPWCMLITSLWVYLKSPSSAVVNLCLFIILSNDYLIIREGLISVSISSEEFSYLQKWPQTFFHRHILFCLFVLLVYVDKAAVVYNPSNCTVNCTPTLTQ